MIFHLDDLRRADPHEYDRADEDYFEGRVRCPNCSAPAYSMCGTCPGAGFECENHNDGCIGCVPLQRGGDA